MNSIELDHIEGCAADWIAERDRCGGHLPAERAAALAAWLAASTAHRVAFLRLDAAWQRADRLRALQSATPLATSSASRGGVRQWFARPMVQRAAVGLSLCVLVAAVGTSLMYKQTSQTYMTEHGQRESIILADGSQLTLNTATKLRTAVNKQARQVWLDRGEAYFDIAHDPQHPFIIHAGKQTVTVLGTKFSLYRDGDRLRVAVVEGRVQVQGGEQSRPALLTRNHAAVADAGNVLVTTESSQQLSASLGWLQGKLVFNDVSLAEAARQFNRYGHKQLVIKDEAAAHISIGGVFDAANVEAFARLLHAGFGLTMQTEGDDILISSPAPQTSSN